MKFNCQARTLILQNLEFHLKRYAANSGLAPAYTYAVLPSGKLFRPLLAVSAFEDSQKDALKELENPTSDLSLLCSGLEMHHAYTLAHDDLPCMDDDDLRRDRASLHKAYGQWQAVLVGDGLLNASYALWANLNASNAVLIRKVCAWALGPKGLIDGQCRDLSYRISGPPSFSHLLTTYELKTARLIQVALISGYLCKKNERRKALWWWRTGLALGLAFQLLDDLAECTRPFSEHEKMVNPWPHFFCECTRKLGELLASLESTREQTPIFYSLFKEFRQKTTALLNEKEAALKSHFDKQQMAALRNAIGTG